MKNNLPSAGGIYMLLTWKAFPRRANKKKAKECFFVSDKRVIYHVLVKDIVHIESKGMRCEIHTSSGAVYCCSKNLGYLCKELKKAAVSICRVHTSYAINTSQIVRVQKEKRSFALMKNGHTIPISKRKKSDFFKKIF